MLVRTVASNNWAVPSKLNRHLCKRIGDKHTMFTAVSSQPKTGDISVIIRKQMFKQSFSKLLTTAGLRKIKLQIKCLPVAEQMYSGLFIKRNPLSKESEL